MTDDREPLGRIVNEVRRAFEEEREAARGAKGPAFYVLPWEQRHPGQQELDMRIGSAGAARAVHDAGLEGERMRMQLFALAAHLPAIRRALVIAIGEAEYEHDAKQYRAALQALGIGGEEEPATPATADPAAPVMPGQLALDSISDEKGEDHG